MKKKAVLAMVASVFLTLWVISGGICAAGEENNPTPKRYRADVYCNFKFDRRVELLFSPAWVGTHESRVFYGPAKISSTPPSSPEGDIVEVEKNGENKWTCRRNVGIGAAGITRDENGKLIFNYTLFYGKWCEGELKLISAP